MDKEKRRIYDQQPEVKERRKKYSQQPEIKERAKRDRQQPEYKKWRKAYNQRPEVKEKKRISNNKYYPKRKERMKEYGKKYRQLPYVKEKMRKKSIRRRFPYIKGSYTLEEWENKLFESKGYCPYCGDYVGIENLSVDHIVPLSRGGTNEITNVLPVCLTCNVRKHTKSKEEFLDGLNYH